MTTIIINNASLLLGQNLDYVERGHIVIEGGVIRRAGEGEISFSHEEQAQLQGQDGNGRGGRNSYKKGTGKRLLDGKGLLIVPGFINAHTHIADSIGKDIASGAGLDARVHPVFGAKKKILERSPPDHIRAFMRNSAISMARRGIVAFADFREGGPEGVRLLREAVAGLPIKCVALGRTNYYFGSIKKGDGKEKGWEWEEEGGLTPEAERQTRQVLELADGLGISGANENTDLALSQYGKLARESGGWEGKKRVGKEKEKKLLAIHAAESKDTVEFSRINAEGRSEVERVVQHLQPDFMVHMTHATDEEISLAAEKGIGVVVCPRANGVLGAGVPRVASMLERGCTVAIGTDNVMLNSPDIFREMDYIWKASRALEGGVAATGSGKALLLEAREVLKMATVNAAKVLRLNSGCIEAGRAADLVFIDKNHIDLSPMHDPYAALVQRANQDAIRGVMVDGRFLVDVEMAAS